jgi:2-phosphoglycerate kinase
VLWLGGMSGVGKTTAARAFALEHELWLYSIDARTYEHAAKLPSDSLTLDERWVDSTPGELADWFEEHARALFALVAADLEAIPDDGAPILVEGPQLLPELVSGKTLFIVAQPDLQRALVIARGSDLYSRTRDPERARANRLARDEILAARLRTHAEVVEVARVEETRDAVDVRFLPVIADWLARDDRGDSEARRRYDEEARERQRRAHAAAVAPG